MENSQHSQSKRGSLDQRDLAEINLTELNELDPLLRDGAQILAEFTFPAFINYIENSERTKTLESREPLKVRVVVEKHGKEDVVKIELMSVYDIYFYYTHV